MIIAIDFDETYNRLPEIWDRFLTDLVSNGHKVYCVTARHERQMEEVRMSIGRVIGHDACIATSGAPKRRFMADVVDTYVDVWIDDNPESIVELPLLTGLSCTEPEDPDLN